MKARLRPNLSSLAITSFAFCFLQATSAAAGTDFVAVDNPHANKAMVQMMAVFAEMERDAISKRTKEALAAARARGVKLGNPRWAETLEATNTARTEAAIALRPVSCRSSGRSRTAASAAFAASPRR
jgi:DNA invertase Pin-like site-specific DNA recombinase